MTAWSIRPAPAAYQRMAASLLMLPTEGGMVPHGATSLRHAPCWPELPDARSQLAQDLCGLSGSSTNCSARRSTVRPDVAPATHAPQQLLDARRAVGPGGQGNRRHQLSREPLAQLHPPLIERVDSPHHALHVHLVLVQGDEAAERAGRGVGTGSGCTDSCPGAPCAEPGVRSASSQSLSHASSARICCLGLPERERLRLREAVREREVLLLLIRDSNR